MKYLFGPVNSRRLGISLGIDLVPYKTCTMNCVYCECGATDCLTGIRREYVPVDEVIAELDSYLSANKMPDAITFSGSGEPTLNSGIGKIISYLKKKYPGCNVVLLTNGSLLAESAVRNEVLNADIVVPSLDAAGEEAFTKIVRPAQGFSAARHIEGLVEFRRVFKGRLILEIFIVPGINDTDDELARIRIACLKIMPDGIQLNSLDRPGTEKNISKAGTETLERIRDYLSPFKVDIIGRPSASAEKSEIDSLDNRILSVLQRRGSTKNDLVSALGADENEVERILQRLIKSGKVKTESLERGDFYTVR